MKTVRQSLFFEAPEQVAIRQETLPPLPPDQVLVKSLFSAISAGTELFVLPRSNSARFAR